MQSTNSSDFNYMLKAINGRFQCCAASLPCDTVKELEQTIASLQQIKNGLEETEEYRAAQAEKERASKDERILQLKKRMEESKAAAERLLGFSLKPEHFNSGNVYTLMPIGYVNRQQFEGRVQILQNPIRNMEERVDRLRCHLSANPTTKSEILQLEAQLHLMRTQLLGFLMAYQPMMDPTFSETLANHLDAMLEAYLELRTLECAEAKASV
jgi:DNA repair exonuclease SbcCD ATPase subunit